MHGKRNVAKNGTGWPNVETMSRIYPNMALLAVGICKNNPNEFYDKK